VLYVYPSTNTAPTTRASATVTGCMLSTPEQRPTTTAARTPCVRSNQSSASTTSAWACSLLVCALVRGTLSPSPLRSKRSAHHPRSAAARASST
jgi:hypothetical protein